MPNSRRVRAMLLALLIMALLPQQAKASSTIDQTSTGTPTATISSTLINQVGQSFTAGRTGALTRIDVSSIVRGGAGGAIGSLTVEVFETSGGLPVGSAIASQSVAESAVPFPMDGSITVEFTSPATVIAGQQYAFTLVPQAENLQISVVRPGTYAGGETLDNGPSTWGPVAGADPDLIFSTYVDSGSSSVVESIPVSLTFAEGSTCTTSSTTGSRGSWINLPAASDCTSPASRTGAVLLGWATSPNFSVDIAKRQVQNGWGAYETFDAAGNLTGVFIPAGGATVLSASGSIYPIWDK